MLRDTREFKCNRHTLVKTKNFILFILEMIRNTNCSTLNHKNVQNNETIQEKLDTPKGLINAKKLATPHHTIKMFNKLIIHDDTSYHVCPQVDQLASLPTRGII